MHVSQLRLPKPIRTFRTDGWTESDWNWWRRSARLKRSLRHFDGIVNGNGYVVRNGRCERVR